jgi:hypothetical protein
MEKYRRNKPMEKLNISELFTRVLSAERKAAKCRCRNCENEYNRAVANFRIGVSRQTGGTTGQQALNDYARGRLDFLFQR